MSPLDCPRLRPYLINVPRIDAAGRYVILFDQLRLSGTLHLSPLEWFVVRLFDGRRNLREIHAEVSDSRGLQIPLEHILHLARRLDECLLLDGERFRQLVDGPIRPPWCIGVYRPEPDELRRQMRDLFTRPGGAGLPGEARPDHRLRAVLAPHIDYGRGGLTYTYAFKELFERSEASLFVIIGTSHYSSHRFTLTRKHFCTPLGVVETDGTYIDRLVKHYGDGLFDDELPAHLPEHSIELELVFLQYLYEGKRDIRIVPLVVGSFEDSILLGETPAARPDIFRMVEALRAVERETAEPICYVISGDLAHIGPEFKDPEPLVAKYLSHSRAQDHALMACAERADAAGYFEVIREERDRRKICGFSPTWLVLEAVRPTRGRLLRYDQYVEPHGQLSVSFASVVFDR
jgi:AmmeMemoRadiSam system protein B